MLKESSGTQSGIGDWPVTSLSVNIWLVVTSSISSVLNPSWWLNSMVDNMLTELLTMQFAMLF